MVTGRPHKTVATAILGAQNHRDRLLLLLVSHALPLAQPERILLSRGLQHYILLGVV